MVSRLRRACAASWPCSGFRQTCGSIPVLDIARGEPGTHNGGGRTVGYSFFDKTPGLTLVFRKRALKPGSAIGYHEQHEDEIYYVLSGHGVMTVDGKAFDVEPGTAVLTRPGSSHGIKQAGTDDLVLLINYEQPAR